MNKIIFISLFISVLLLGQKSFGWLYTLCNDTDKPVSVDTDYHFCYAEAPKINTLNPKTCAVIDNSKSLFLNCLIDTIKFTNVERTARLASAGGQSYLNPTTWGDYTYILRDNNGKYQVDVKSGVEIPQGNRTVAVFKNYAGLGWKEWVTGLGSVPASSILIPTVASGATSALSGMSAVGLVLAPLSEIAAVATTGPVALAAGVVALTAFGAVTVIKDAMDTCFRNGKYIVWVDETFNKNPSEVIDMNLNTICGVQLTSELSRKFPYIL